MSEDSNCVYYAKRDYAGAGRRYLSFVIDFLFVMFVWWCIYAVASMALVPAEITQMPPSLEKQQAIREFLQQQAMWHPLHYGFLCFTLIYYILLRRTRFGTLGYIITRMRLVDETGNPPPLQRVIKRFLLAVPFCLPFGVFYLACRKQERKQTIHDQLSGTWMVRASAKPAGRAQIAYQTKLLGTYMLTYIDVEPYNANKGDEATQTADKTTTVEEHAATA